MTSTIFLSLSKFISIFAFVSFCKQSFKIFCKICSHPEHGKYVLAAMLVAVIPFDSRLQRSQLLHDSHKAKVSLTHGYRTTVANTRFLQTGQPMSSSTPIHIYLTTSVNIRLTHGSRTTITNTEKARLIRKSCQKMSFGFPIKSQKKSLYIHRHPNKLPLNGGDNMISERSFDFGNLLTIGIYKFRLPLF